jgi:hypothetical protein
MNSPPPETARVTTPHSPRAPAVAVDVRSWMLGVIHDISPASATIISPGSSPISSTGIVVPTMRDSMACPAQPPSTPWVQTYNEYRLCAAAMNSRLR